MSAQIDKIVNAYKTLAKIPSIAGGKLNRAGNRVSANWSVRAIDKMKSAKYSSNYILDENLKVIAESDFGTDVSNELLSAVSPKETYKAVVRKEKNEKDVMKQYLEVWSRTTLQHCIDLTALDLHGDVYADSEFGCLDWSPDETALVYVAERKPPKSEAYIKRKAADDATSDASKEPAKRGEEFVYRQDWGEQLVGKFSSVIVVCRLPSETVSLLDRLPASACPGQVKFSPDGSSVVGVAWETEPRRLGLIFCTNRPSYIFSLPLEGGEMKKLSRDGVAVRSPRYSPRGEVVWLQREAGGPHHAAHQLLIRRNHDEEVSTVIDIVQNGTDITNGVFYGLYCQSLPSNCFTEDGRIVFSTPQENEVRSYIVDVDGGSIVDISNGRAPGSTSVLDVRGDVILSTHSNVTTPGQLFVARVPARGDEPGIQWMRVSDAADTPPPPELHAATSEYLQLRHDSNETVNSFTAIYTAPATAHGAHPLIVWPHGGPHSSFANAYSLETALYIMLGFACVQVNYRGSIGAGERALRSLPGRCGHADVADCVLATRAVLARYPVDSNNVFLSGGSHGGFLVTHLSGQHPELYAAVVSRNPVIDIATMYNYTDINDWCAVEAGFEWSERGPVSEQHLVEMRRCSPLVHVHRVRAPTALLLGGADRRVPAHQGLQYARRLTANSVHNKVYMYDDNHSLSSLPAEMDHLINGANWFLTHLKE